MVKNIEMVTRFVYTGDCNIDLEALSNSARIVAQRLQSYKAKTIFTPNYSGIMPDIAKKMNTYNFFHTPLPQVHELFNCIQYMFKSCLNTQQEFLPIEDASKKMNYCCHGWLNVYKQNEFHDYHRHYRNSTKSWHGFFYLNVDEKSGTQYKWPDGKTHEITGANNKLVLAYNTGEEHRTIPWKQSGNPRMSIAFDIVPDEFLHHNWNGILQNTWVPVITH